MCKHLTEHFSLSIILLIFFSISLIQAQVDTLWTKTFCGIDYAIGFSVQQTKDDGYILTGVTTTLDATDSDILLIKTAADGDTIWTKTFGGSDRESGYSVQQTIDDGYIVVGSSYSFNDGNSDFWLIKTDASGDTLWTKKYRGNCTEGFPTDFISVQQTTDEGYIITGDLDIYTGG